MFTNTTRVIKYAFQNFFRNFWLSFVTLTILFLALTSVNTLIVLNLLADKAIKTVEDRIDVSIYFKSEVREDQIINVQTYLLAQEGVKDVTYVSREQALVNFKLRHADNPRVLESVEALGDNPLGAALIIHANDPRDYENIITALSGDQYSSLIEDKDFEDYRAVIDKIGRVTARLSFAMTVMAIVFGLISILIVFNTLRVAVYTHRDEIRIMRLVGATDGFILAPYILEAIIFAVFSLALTILVFYPLLGLIQPYVSTFFTADSLNLVQYFNDNFLKIFGLELAGACILNVFSALVATTKYLKD